MGNMMQGDRGRDEWLKATSDRQRALYECSQLPGLPELLICNATIGHVLLRIYVTV